MKNRPRATDTSREQTDDDAFTVSDEALERAAGGASWAPMLTGVATICGREMIVAVRRSGSSAK
jgi:hypothetical protein